MLYTVTSQTVIRPSIKTILKLDIQQKTLDLPIYTTIPPEAIGVVSEELFDPDQSYTTIEVELGGQYTFMFYDAESQTIVQKNLYVNSINTPDSVNDVYQTYIIGSEESVNEYNIPIIQSYTIPLSNLFNVVAVSPT